MFSDDDDDVNV